MVYNRLILLPLHEISPQVEERRRQREESFRRIELESLLLDADTDDSTTAGSDQLPPAPPSNHKHAIQQQENEQRPPGPITEDQRTRASSFTRMSRGVSESGPKVNAGVNERSTRELFDEVDSTVLLELRIEICRKDMKTLPTRQLKEELEAIMLMSLSELHEVTVDAAGSYSDFQREKAQALVDHSLAAFQKTKRQRQRPHSTDKTVSDRRDEGRDL